MILRRYCLFLILAQLLPGSIGADLMAAEAVTLKSEAEQSALLELYTSEGCSSCPPAEKWVSGLLDSPHLWTQFVPVAFHVDYWNHLGWRDDFSDKRFTDRQRVYAKRWGAGSIYTPSVVVNGIEWGGWSRGQDMPRKSSTPGVLKVTKSIGSEYLVSFVPSKELRATRFIVHAALTGFGINVKVKAGENRGRTLTHDFTVLSFDEKEMQKLSTEYLSRISLPMKTLGSKRLGVSVWVTAHDDVNPLQAVGGFLPEKLS